MAAMTAITLAVTALGNWRGRGAGCGIGIGLAVRFTQRKLNSRRRTVNAGTLEHVALSSRGRRPQ
jgi:hypothetical protein